MSNKLQKVCGDITGVRNHAGTGADPASADENSYYVDCNGGDPVKGNSIKLEKNYEAKTAMQIAEVYVYEAIGILLKFYQKTTYWLVI